MAEETQKKSKTTDSLKKIKTKKLNNQRNKPRYRHSITTQSPIVILTPPNPMEEEKEKRRLSNASAASIASAQSNASSGSTKNEDETGHLIPPSHEEVMNTLIHQRRPSTMSVLAEAIKELYTKKKIKEDGIPPKIIEGVYLGSIGAAKNIEWLKSNGITHILCVAGGIGKCFPKQFIYKVIDINDAPDENITSYFNECYQFIENALQSSGQVLVHCFAGMSRSVTVMSAYLMQKRRMYAVPAL
eukprot:284042_1